MVDLSVVIPAYNEGRIIADSLARLTCFLDEHSGEPDLWSSWEIQVVDDGSFDGTGEAAIAAAAREPRISVTRLDVNSGKGAAVKAGVDRTRGSIVLLTDVDLSYALEDLARAVRALRGIDPGGDLDMVFGDRRHPSSRLDFALASLGHVMRRQVISLLFNRTVRLFYRLPWKDTQCGLKGFRRDAAIRIMPLLRTTRFLADIEMFIIAGRLGLRIGRIPVHLTYLSDNSTVHVVRQSPRVVADALRIKSAQLRGRYG